MADIRDEINLCDGIEFNKENIEVEKVQVQNEVKKEKKQIQTQEKQLQEKALLQEEQVQEKQQEQIQDGEVEKKEQVQESNGENLPIKQGFWERFKVFWFEKIDWNKEIKIKLTPHQQKIEKEINEFLHQEVTWKKIHDFLFKKKTFGKKKAEI